jgi:YidC/Oxa1 family membrane protein insertase
MLIPLPIWIVLYQTVLRVMAAAPEEFLNLSQRLYTNWPIVFTQLPLGHRFLWLDLAAPDMFLAVLTGAGMWVQQKMTTPPTTDPQQRMQSEMMLWMMPIMFAMLGLSFPSGLSLYWVTSTTIRIVMQYFATGWGGLIPAKQSGGKPKEIKGRVTRQKKDLTAADTSADIVIKPEPAKGEGTDGQSGDKRQDGGRGNPKGFRAVRRDQGGSRGNRR